MTRLGPRLNIKTVFPRHGILMLKIWRSWDRHILNMGNPILVRRHLYVQTGPSNGRILENVNYYLYDYALFLIIQGLRVFLQESRNREMAFKLSYSYAIWQPHTAVHPYIGALKSQRPVAYAIKTWGRVTHLCVGNLTIIGPDNDLSTDRRQSVIWNTAGILLIESSRTNFSEISIGIHTFSINGMPL